MLARRRGAHVVSSWRRSGSSSSVGFPASIVERMRQGEVAIADRFPEAAILFSDLVGLSKSKMSKKKCPTLSRLKRRNPPKRFNSAPMLRDRPSGVPCLDLIARASMCAPFHRRTRQVWRRAGVLVAVEDAFAVNSPQPLYAGEYT